MCVQSVGNIYKGLAQSGAWGCFDEFNRISVEVLSVVAVQVKCIQDAIKARKKVFNFIGEEIRLTPSVGLFITMNPGYAGRAELPENLKALFRLVSFRCIPLFFGFQGFPKISPNRSTSDSKCRTNGHPKITRKNNHAEKNKSI